TNTETSTEFMQRFLRLAGFLGAAAVANVARNYEILHERDDDDAERPDKRRVVIGISRALNRVVTGTTVIIMTVMDQTGEVVVTTTAAATTTTLATTTGFQQSRGPSEGYSYSVCTTCGRIHPGEFRRAAGTCFKCGQTGHLQKDCKKNTTASTSGQADRKPGASGRVFAITEDHATKTSGTITVFVLFDTGATHSVISSVFASCVTTTPTLLDHHMKVPLRGDATGSREEKMKSEDAKVKNSILTPGGERKRIIHRISKIRKEDLDNICEGKIMAILKGFHNKDIVVENLVNFVDNNYHQSFDCSTIPAHRQAITVVDNYNHSENRSRITRTSMSRHGAVVVGHKSRVYYRKEKD
nr:hypothetical protein [Tanacetum cinerariifolium]